MNNPLLKRLFSFSAAVIIGLIFLFPLLWMLWASLLPDREVLRGLTSLGHLFQQTISFENYLDVFQRVSFVRSVVVSFAFISVIAFAGLFINSACAYAFARLEFAGREVLFTVVIALIIIPFEAVVAPLFMLIGIKWNLMNSLPGLFLPYLAKAFNIFFLRQYFLSLPKDLEEAARVEGASWFRIYFRIALPLAKPALITCIILDFIMHWSEYLWPLIITNRTEYETVQLGLGHFYTLPPIQWGDIMAYSVMATIPMLLMFLFFQKYLTSALTHAGLKF